MLNQKNAKVNLRVGDGQWQHLNLDIILLNLVEPEFNSALTDLIIELNHLKKKRLGGTTPAPIFFNLKSIFHMLERLDSRTYVISFGHSYLLRGVIRVLGEKGFLPQLDEKA